MKRMILWLASVFQLVTLASNELGIIPTPEEVKIGQGEFKLPKKFVISVNGKAKLNNELLPLFGIIKEKTGENPLVKKSKTAAMKVVLVKGENPEAYTLEITSKRIQLVAEGKAGVFYGAQTLAQIIANNEKIPTVKINDMPRYGWRGIMLDESRHFMGKEQVKLILDEMARYKMNRFHWHLTDTDGWRIEIKKYPKLTSVGGIGDRSNKNAPAQFYTQDEIKEIVAYAKARHIEVIPEIDMPGHAAAANKAYPEFSGGGSKKHPEFTFNPGKEATYKYLTDILKEVTALFPSKWLHIGGDEVHFGWEKWNHLPEVKELMKRENLKSLSDVEHYFIRRMAKVINGLGKTLVGWDEITNSGVSNETTMLMWWRHDKAHLRDKALKSGFKTVLCPRLPCYFDFVQHNSHKVGRRWGGFSSLDRIIKFPQFPAKLNEKDLSLVQGIQCNLWTEKVVTTDRMQYMIFPRMYAIAESSWSVAKRKNYDNFLGALKLHLPRLKKAGIKYFDPNNPEATPEIRR